MRNRSLALLVVLVLAFSASAADSVRDRRDAGGLLDRVVRVIKHVFGVTTNTDSLMPPKP
jgi:hypothetical protein